MNYRNITILLFLICITKSVSQSILQQIPNEGSTVGSFVPTNYKIIDSVKVDFNNDSLADIALVIKQTTAVIQKDNDCEGEEYYPKCLLIIFKTKQGYYKLSQKTQTIFGKCNWGLQGGDPFTSIKNRKNTIRIEFFTGGTTRIIPIYYFKYQREKWILVGYTEEKMEVPSNDAIVEDYNVIRGVKEKFELIDGKKKNVKISKFKPLPLIELRNLDATGGGVKGLTY